MLNVESSWDREYETFSAIPPDNSSSALTDFEILALSSIMKPVCFFLVILKLFSVFLFQSRPRILLNEKLQNLVTVLNFGSHMSTGVQKPQFKNELFLKECVESFHQSFC